MRITIRTSALFLCGLLLGLASAQAADQQVTKSFVYKKTKQADLELVVHYPPGWKDSDKRPAVVFFFGGGWTGGKIEQFEPQASHLARRGMVAARADYRVKSRHGVTPKEGVEDAKSAVRWMRAHAAKLGVDPDRIVAAGGSAGGHIAACTAFTPGLDADDEDAKTSSKPNALVLFNPVLPFTGIPQLMERIDNDEITAASVKGIDAIKPKLDELEAGETVFPCGRRLADQAPDGPAKETRTYCRKLGLDVQRGSNGRAVRGRT